MAESEKFRTLLIGLHSFGSINYYRTLIQYDKLEFEIYEHFRKGSSLARYQVAGAGGRLLLAIPLVHEARGRTPFSGLRISNRDRWQLVHWRTLTSAYGRSPWFAHYETELRRLYTEPFERLGDWNRAAFDLVTKWLNVSWEISVTRRYLARYPDAEVDDMRELQMPAREAELFDADVLRYPQVFEDRTGFIPGLSILDLLFSEGSRSLDLLKDAR
jgi:hypothetical protein